MNHHWCRLGRCDGGSGLHPTSAPAHAGADCVCPFVFLHTIISARRRQWGTFSFFVVKRLSKLKLDRGKEGQAQGRSQGQNASQETFVYIL